MGFPGRQKGSPHDLIDLSLHKREKKEAQVGDTDTRSLLGGR